MFLPINGRIAIIDDQISQAESLIKVLSKNRNPISYYSGELEYLPEEDDDKNDIRILFLDINLIDNSEKEDKVLKSTLFPVLNRIISKKNYPYIIVYWSRHESHKNLIENDLFKNDLKEKRPIGFITANKLDFFDLDGNKTDAYEQNLKKLFENINNLFESYFSYKILLLWENFVHKSADFTLQEIFADFHYDDNWNNNSNFIINKLGKAYLGNYYDNASEIEKISAGLESFNSVFKDSIDDYTSKIDSSYGKALEVENNSVNADKIILQINEKLNFTKNINDNNTPGNIIFFEEEDLFKKILNKILSLFKLRNKLKVEKPNIEDALLKKECSSIHKNLKDEIKKTWYKIGLIVSPVCDFAQKNNHINNRVVHGLLIKSEFKEYIDTNSEAIFILPFPIQINNINYDLILDFRFFTTSEKFTETDTPDIKLRIRNEILSEVQSRLARHINRQGIFFID